MLIVYVKLYRSYQHMAGVTGKKDVNVVSPFLWLHVLQSLHWSMTSHSLHCCINYHEIFLSDFSLVSLMVLYLCLEAVHTVVDMSFTSLTDYLFAQLFSRYSLTYDCGVSKGNFILWSVIWDGLVERIEYIIYFSFIYSSFLLFIYPFVLPPSPPPPTPY